MKTGQNNDCRAETSRRSGAAIVEFAVLLPLLLMLLVGSIEFGRAISVVHTLSEAARSGVRVYSLTTEKNEQDVLTAVGKVMNDAGFSNYTVKLDPVGGTALNHLEPLTVTVSLAFDKANPAPWFLMGQTITANCVMPADTRANSENVSPSGPILTNPGSDPTAEGSGDDDDDDDGDDDDSDDDDDDDDDDGDDDDSDD